MVPSYEYLSAAEVAKAVPKWTYKLGLLNLRVEVAGTREAESLRCPSLDYTLSKVKCSLHCHLGWLHFAMGSNCD